MPSTYSSLLVLGSAGLSTNNHPEDSGTLQGLEGLPPEILIDVYLHLDVETIYELAQTNTLFYGLFHRNKAKILLPVLEREFHPFDELLQVYTASDDDLEGHGDTYQPRKIVYRRYPGDITGVLLCRGGMSLGIDLLQPKPCFTDISASGRPTVSTPLSAPRSVALTEHDLPRLLRYCAVARKWEDIYPQLHWLPDPENCRILYPAEREKLRRALYRWWLHARYFHGDRPRPRRGEPEPFVHDVRTSQMRMYPTADLMELRALMVAVKNLIRHYIFPNLEQNMSETISTPLEQLIELSIRERIVNTYAKLDPKELMFYFENLYNYPRKRLVTDVNSRHPTFVHDQESLQAAIKSATDERQWLDGIDNLEGTGCIVGHPSFRDYRLSKDGSMDASVPAPGILQRPRGDWSPPGDDGRALAERSHFSVE